MIRSDVCSAPCYVLQPPTPLCRLTPFHRPHKTLPTAAHSFGLGAPGNEDATPDSAYSSSGAGAGAGNSSSLAGLLGSPARRTMPGGGYQHHQHHQFYPSGEALNPTYASNINLCISDDIIISVTDHDDESDLQQQQQQEQQQQSQRFNPTTIASSSSSSNRITTAATNTNTHFIASPKSSSSSTVSSPRSPRFAQRNPVTGNGVEDYADKPRKPSSRRGGNSGWLIRLLI